MTVALINTNKSNNVSMNNNNNTKTKKSNNIFLCLLKLIVDHIQITQKKKKKVFSILYSAANASKTPAAISHTALFYTLSLNTAHGD